MAQEQAAMGLQPPPVKYVDGAYISAAGLAAAAAQGVELVGPAQAGKKRDEDAFSVEDFKVDVEQKQAICPAGKPSDQCSRLAAKRLTKSNFASSGTLRRVGTVRYGRAAWVKNKTIKPW